jgi:glyoxylase-like metal-dependent hydrolase (beta-lactamase superfamily II)
MLVSTPAAMLRMFGAKASPPADRTLHEGEIISIGPIRLLVLHTPGHSPGSMVLHADGYAFTGDTLFVEAVGRTDLPGGSWEVMSDSLQRKVCTLPDETVVLPGHNYGSMPTSTIGHEKQFNPFLR